MADKLVRLELANATPAQRRGVHRVYLPGSANAESVTFMDGVCDLPEQTASVLEAGGVAKRVRKAEVS